VLAGSVSPGNRENPNGPVSKSRAVRWDWDWESSGNAPAGFGQVVLHWLVAGNSLSAFSVAEALGMLKPPALFSVANVPLIAVSWST